MIDKNKVLIYDCEIVRCIPGRDGYRDPDLKYCDGWHDFGGMGISLIGCWWRGDVKMFPQSAFGVFQRIVNEAELIIGFNSISFDDKLCRANGVQITTNYDLLQEVWWAAGMPRQYTYGKTRAGYRLENLAQANLGRGKSGSGELVPVLWQQGRQSAVLDYLCDDVLITKAVWDKRLALKDPTRPYLTLRLREPWEPMDVRYQPASSEPQPDCFDIPF